MKRLLYFAAAAMAVLSACTKEDPIVEVGTEPESVSMPVFTATIEGPATKTTLGEGNKVNWENGDDLYLSFYTVTEHRVGNPYSGYHNEWRQSGGESKAIYDVVPKQEDASSADLNFSRFLLQQSGNDLSSGNWHVTAVYPSSMVQSSDNFNTTRMVFPATQSYREDMKSYAPEISFAPMYYSGYETSFTMKNAAAILKITVPSIITSSVERITVSSDKWMNGNCEFINDVIVKSTDTANYGEQDADANKMITLDCTTYSSYGVFTDSNPSFYITIPAQHYDYLEITIDGNHTMRTKKAAGIDVERNKIYPITFADNYAPGSLGTATRTGEVSVNWVQLWENGPKFATYNVGAENNRPEDVGGYYCWGSSIDKDANKAYYTGDGDLPDSYDTATNLWGSNWRMPTKREIDDLMYFCDFEIKDNYNSTGVAGVIFTGKEAYSENSIFLPVTGHSNGDYFDDWYIEQGLCQYWTSTTFTNGNAFIFVKENQYSIGSSNERKFYGLPVRAVLK